MIQPAEARGLAIDADAGAEAARRAVISAEQALTDAKSARARAEKEAVEARKVRTAAEERLRREAAARLNDLDRTLAAALQLAQQELDSPVAGPLRGEVRMWLHSGVEPSVAGTALRLICERDPVAAALFDCSRAAGTAMQWLMESWVDAETLRRCDQIECRAWRGLVDRLYRVAGEVA